MNSSLFFTHQTVKPQNLMESSPVDFYYTKAGGGDNNNNNTNNSFIIDDLLDFSNEEDDTLFNDSDTFHHHSIHGNNSTDSTVTAVDSCNSSLSGHFDVSQHSFPDSAATPFDVPYDDMAELEWLSNFVEESFSSEEDIHKLNLISGVKTEVISEQTGDDDDNDNDNDNENDTDKHQHPIFRSEITVPGKARSKRARIAPCNWSSRILAITPSPATSEASETNYVPFSSGKKPLKVHRKKDNLVSDGRRCLHCATDKTPQWRTGPLGPKTLCNACGVRFKSGRLVPEYRPANSPTFMLSKHSNSHRKVMEMRRQKEMQRSQREQFLYAPMFDVSGCADEYLIHHDTGSDFSQLI